MTAVAEQNAVTTTDDKEAEGRRKLAILKAVGLDRVSTEQRELSLAIANRYDLDLMLKHLVLIDGKPYVTRDALLWIAHRSGQFDGITVTKPAIVDKFWECEASVFRKDMSHPFTYPGRYPVDGQNKKFAPEMAIKVAESMALRRAFNISAPTQDERWDVEVPQAEPEPPKSLADKVAARAAAVEPTDAVEAAEAVFEGEIVSESSEPVEAATEPQKPVGMVQCESKSPFGTDEAPIQCRREMGHKGPHRTENESWPA